MRIIKSFVASLRLKWLHWRVDREIYSKIGPHLYQNRPLGYPFHTNTEMEREANIGHKNVILMIEMIGKQASQMGVSSGNALRYIVYRDIIDLLDRYEKIIIRDRQPSYCDPRHVATRS